MALPITAELLKGGKRPFETIRKMVIEHGFGVTPFDYIGIPCGMSHGINYALLCKSITIEEVEAALQRFLFKDYGTYYGWDEPVQLGNEYGEYPSSYGATSDVGAIMVHKENSPLVPWKVVVYFNFER